MNFACVYLFKWYICSNVNFVCVYLFKWYICSNVNFACVNVGIAWAHSPSTHFRRCHSPILQITIRPMDEYKYKHFIMLAVCAIYICTHLGLGLGVCINIEGHNAQVLKVPQWELWIWLIFQLGVPDVGEHSWYIVSFAFDGWEGWGTFWNWIPRANQRAHLLFVLKVKLWL